MPARHRFSGACIHGWPGVFRDGRCVDALCPDARGQHADGYPESGNHRNDGRIAGPSPPRRQPGEEQDARACQHLLKPEFKGEG